MATVTTTVTGYNIKSAPLAAEKVTSFMTTSYDDEGRKTAELVRKSSSSSASRAPRSSCSKDETPQHSHFVVVAVDFGTAYSGYAYR